MNFQRKRVATALACVLGAAGTATVTEALAQAPDIRVDVTGSSIRRVEAEGALPVTIITKDEIAKIGAVNTEQLLQTVSAINTLGGNRLGNISLSTYGQESISMRGLGSYRTLVLVNGRRVAPFAGDDGASVNVNSIPLAAIERVEVLRDGASAVYGSDAIAGVVNFILTKDYTGAEAGITYGAPTRSGDGDNFEAHAVAGWGNLDKDRFNITVSGSYHKEDKLLSKDRDYAKTSNKLPWLVSQATGQGNIEGAYTPGTGQPSGPFGETGKTQPGFGASPGTGYGNPLGAQNRCEDINMFLNPDPTAPSGGKPGGYPYCQFDSGAFLNLLPEREAWNFSGNFVFKLTNDIQFFADALYAKQTVTNLIQPSPVRRSFYQSDSLFGEKGIDPANLIFPSNPAYQIAADYLNSIGQGAIVGQPLAVTGRVFDFGGRGTEDEAEQWRGVAGLRGNWMKQDWEVAYTHNENKLEGKTISGYFSQTEYARVFQTTNYNPWSLTQDPAIVAALAAANYVGPTLNSKAKSDAFDAKISGDVLQLPAGAMSYAAGYQWRKEGIDLQPSPALETGDIAGLGGGLPPMNKDRKVNAIFGEILVPIIKDVEANAAIRYDDYNDVGSTTNYYVNLRWQPVRQLLLRTAYGTGFRAPTLLDLYQPQVFGSTEQFNDPATGQNSLQVNGFSGGNPNLKPETSEQWSLGFVWQPVRQFSFGVDWWQVKLDDIISTPSAQEVVSGFRNGDATYANSVRLTPEGDVESIDTFIVNAGKAKVEGYDINANYRDSFPWGEVGLNFQGTYIDRFDQTSPGGVEHHKVATLVDANGDPVIGAADTGGVVVRWKHVLQATYGYRDWAFTLTQNYYSGYETGVRQFDFERNFVGGQSIFDFQVAYTGIKNLRLALGVKNMFDKDPPIFIGVANEFQAGYDPSMYDPRSRFVYGSVNWKFW